MKKGYENDYEINIIMKNNKRYILDLYNDNKEKGVFILAKKAKNDKIHYYVKDEFDAIALLEEKYLEANE